MLLAFAGSSVPKITLIIGISQFLSAYSLFYFGWLWSVAWGVIVFLHKEYSTSDNQLNPANPYEQHI